MSPYILEHPLIRGTLLQRENRFICYVKVAENRLRCYLPNPGRMVEFLHPGKLVYLQMSTDSTRTTDATLVAIDIDNEIIQLDSNLVSKLIPYAIKNQVKGLEDLKIIRSEIPANNHRFDFLVQRDEEEVLVEVKSTTMVVEGVACFPDAVSKRASSHLQSLMELSKTRPCMVIFMVYRKASWFSPCRDIDPEFSKIFDQTRQSDVEIRVMQCSSTITQKHDEYYLEVEVHHPIQLRQ
ncbi:MAG: DNA/RNA nuclease SfsA [Candidatus Heimdallarchaeota archaeon]|nr:DNA/RNA nuclease SfsA [Candidatus Heimdallarchaeota archaeon]